MKREARRYRTCKRMGWTYVPFVWRYDARAWALVLMPLAGLAMWAVILA